MDGNLIYFLVKIVVIELDPQTGRSKNIKEEKLVKAYSVGDAEKSVYEKYEGDITDWRIVSISESKINEVIEQSEKTGG